MPTVLYSGVLDQELSQINELFKLASGDLTMAIKAADGTTDLADSSQAGSYKIIFVNAPQFEATRNYSVTLAEGTLLINRPATVDDDDDDRHNDYRKW